MECRLLVLDPETQIPSDIKSLGDSDWWVDKFIPPSLLSPSISHTHEGGAPPFPRFVPFGTAPVGLLPGPRAGGCVSWAPLKWVGRMLALFPVGEHSMQAWGLRPAGAVETRPAAPLGWVVMSTSTGRGCSTHWGPADKSGLHTVSFVGEKGASCPQHCWNRQLLFPATLAVGTHLCQAAFWGKGAEPGRALGRVDPVPPEARRAGHPSHCSQGRREVSRWAAAR